MKSLFWCGEHSCTGWSQEEPREKTAVLAGATGWGPHCSQKPSLWEKDSQALLPSLCTRGRDMAQPPPASAPSLLELQPGGGQGSCPICMDTRTWMDLGHQWAKAPSLGTSRLPSSLSSEAVLVLWSSTEQWVTQSGASKSCALAPLLWWCGFAQCCSLWWTQEAFNAFFSWAQGWHECFDLVKLVALTLRYILLVVLGGWLTSNWDYEGSCLLFGDLFGIWVFTNFFCTVLQ